MSKINWKRLLDDNSIEYIEAGANVAKGNVNIHCVFCGAADPSHHLGLNLTTGYWGCWRNSAHRGRSPVRLLMALLHISFAQACVLAGVDEQTVDTEGYEAIKNNPFGNKVASKTHLGSITMPNEFEEITHNRARMSRFIHYLVEQRGFEKKDVMELCRVYKLRAATHGEFKDRLIIPYYMDWQLVTWTGRAIGESSLRYLDLAKDQSVVPAKNILLNFNSTKREGKILLVTEGPMDCLKLDMYSRKFGVRAVAISTNSISDNQIYLLEEASVNFEKVLVMMDNSNQLGMIDSFYMKEKLSQIKNIGFVKVPFGRKDGGDLTPKEVIAFAENISV